MDKFRTKSGRLTPYALACGYIERKETKTRRLELWHEGACFHVKAHDFAEHCRLFWESFQTLSEARRYFDTQARAVFQ